MSIRGIFCCIQNIQEINMLSLNMLKCECDAHITTTDRLTNILYNNDLM